MRVGICDDDSKWYQCAKEIIEGYGKKTDTKIEILYFPQGESLEVYEGDPLDVIFMDVKKKAIISKKTLKKIQKNTLPISIKDDVK